MVIYDHNFFTDVNYEPHDQTVSASYHHRVCVVFIFSLNYIFENCSYKKLNSYILLLQYIVLS